VVFGSINGRSLRPVTVSRGEHLQKQLSVGWLRTLGSLIAELRRTQSASGGRCPAITDSPLPRIAFTVGFNRAESAFKVGAWQLRRS
jgi:hypothetical protein